MIKRFSFILLIALVISCFAGCVEGGNIDDGKKEDDLVDHPPMEDGGDITEGNGDISGDADNGMSEAEDDMSDAGSDIMDDARSFGNDVKDGLKDAGRGINDALNGITGDRGRGQTNN